MEETQKKKLEGIDGWLLFWAVSLGLGILNIFINFWFNIKDILHEKQVYLNNLELGPVFARNVPNLSLQYGQIIFSAINLLLTILTLVLIYKRKKIAKMFSIIFIWVVFLVYGIAPWIILATNKTLSAQIGPGAMLVGPVMILTSITSLIMAIIWTIYFRKSERVKNTLVN